MVRTRRQPTAVTGDIGRESERVKKYTAAALLVVAGIGHAQAPAPKIVGGSDTTDSYPWMAGLHGKPSPGQYFVYPFCGGSLIAPG